MMKKSLFIKSFCTLALAGVLLSNVQNVFAKSADNVFTYPCNDKNQQLGLISREVTGASNADKSEIFFTADSTYKLNCTSEEVMRYQLGDTTFAVAFFPNIAMDKNGLFPENLTLTQARNWSKERYWYPDAVYYKETPYSFGQACNIVYPEMFDYITEYGAGTLMVGIIGTKYGDFIRYPGIYYPDDSIHDETGMQYDMRAWYNNVTLNDFIMDTSEQIPAPLPPASEIKETEAENIPTTPDLQVSEEIPTVEIPLQTNGEGITYTVAKYDTLGVIALNYYGSYEASKQLYDVNKDVLLQNGNKLNEGIQLKLPAVLGNYSLIAPPQLTGSEKLYSVKAGDTLRTIAQNEYGDSSLYQAIFERNTDRIKDVNHIYEGLIIVCP